MPFWNRKLEKLAMPLLSQRILRGLIPARFSADRPPARKTTPDRIILGVRPGHRPSQQPPVRIFLGTERGQFRAERIFIWSIEKNRDPSRIYEIYLMRDIKGFRRGFWLTGFTNYRFAIPGFAGFDGRAIYNDADQVYLTDPAELFDTPMDRAGFLSINDRDTSVMLIDCKRMAEVWNEHDVRRLSRKALEARARQAGLWGDLDNGWNARDSEYVPGQSRLVHFTTLHTQPWRPFPAHFVYFDNPTGDLWPAMEREADAARFLPVSATRPSRDWANVHLFLSSRKEGPRLQALLAPAAPAERQDKLSIDGLLEHVPDQDVPWVLERLFGLADQLQIAIREPVSSGGGRYRRHAWFWLQQFQQAGRIHSSTRWTLTHASAFGRRQQLHGGPLQAGSIAVLLHRKPGHNQQARAIAESLARQTGRTLKEYPLETSEAGFLARRLLGIKALPQLADDTRLIVAGGWLPTSTARLLARRQPALRLLLAGRKAGPAEETASVIIQCRHFGLPPHRHRLTSLLPLNAGLPETDGSSTAWAAWLNSPKRAAALIGGDSRSHRLNATEAGQLVRTLSSWAKQSGHRLLLVTSRRSQHVISALNDSRGSDDLLYTWQADDPDNPYRLALDQADTLIVTGESESMLADAASRGRGFLIYPLTERAPSPWRRLSTWVAEKAVRPRFNRRGSIRPQQGLTYLCARALERAWILPPRRLDQLHQSLYRAGMAAEFGQPAPAAFKQHDELDAIVAQSIALLETPSLTRQDPHQESHHEQRQPPA
jgi:uncharacterized protein